MVWNSKTACKHALGHLGLVGRVGRHELGAAGQGTDHRRHLVVVGAPAGEADQVVGAGPDWPRPSDSMRASTSGSGEPVVHGQAATQAQRRRDAGEELIERRQARERPASAPTRPRCGAGSRATYFLHPRRPQRRSYQVGRQLTSPLHHGHRVAVEQLGIGLDQGQPDPPFPHRRVVAARQRAHDVATDLDLSPVAQRLATLGHQTAQAPRSVRWPAPLPARPGR